MTAQRVDLLIGKRDAGDKLFLKQGNILLRILAGDAQFERVKQPVLLAHHDADKAPVRHGGGKLDAVFRFRSIKLCAFIGISGQLLRLIGKFGKTAAFRRVLQQLR